MIKLSSNSKIYNIVLIGIVVGIMLIFTFLALNREPEVEKIEKEPVGLDAWTIENSVLNGAPLVENKNIYASDDEGKIETVYLSVFPTKTEDGSIIDLSAFDLHESHNKNYNPKLDVNVTFGDASGKLSPLVNDDLVNGNVRVRGNSARGEAYKSYKIKITDESNDGLYGMETLNLNKHVGDYSKITNKLAFDIFKNMDNMVSFRTNFVVLYMRDASLPVEEQTYEYMGLYTNIEQPNKDYLTAHGLDSNGSVYKANMFEFRPHENLKNINDPEYVKEDFEAVLGIREGSDHTKILKMIEDVNNMDLDFNQVFQTYFNEENYLTWLACNILLGSEDIISHNYLLYNPSNSATWYFVPWDYDKTFKLWSYTTGYVPPMCITKGIQKYSGVQLHGRYLKQPGNIEKLNDKLKELMETTFREDNLSKLINKYRPVLEATMTQSPDVGLLYFAPSKLNGYLDMFPDYIEQNYQDYFTTLQYPLPFFTANPVRTTDGKVKFAWSPSYDFQGDLLKYSIKITSDYRQEHVVFTATDLIATEYIYEGSLEPGTYYMDIKVTDSAGNTQYSHDFYEDNIDDYYAYSMREINIE